MGDTLARPAAGELTASPGRATGWLPTLHLALLLLGCAASGMAYDRLEAIWIGPGMLLLGAVPVIAWGVAARALPLMLAAYVRMFCVGWFAAGVAALYAQFLADPYQVGSDAHSFFLLSSGDSSGLSLDDIRELSEGAGAVVLWRAFYDFAEAALGFSKQRYVGIALNTIIVALSAAVALSICRSMFGRDTVREQRLMAMFGACGLLWLFAAIHLRDSVVLLAATLTTWAWVRYLRRPGATALLALAAMLAVLTAAFAVLRTEFVFVPLVASTIGLLSILLGANGTVRPSHRWLAAALLATGAAIAWGLLGQAFEAAEAGSGNYKDLVRGEASAGSLGAQLVVNQPPPVRLVVGSLYLLLFPIPAWAGLIGDSALHLFKSLNLPLFYVLLPMLVLAAGDLLRRPALRNPENLFVLGMSLAFLGAIALTSLESRHFGAFLAPVFLLALLPDPRAPGAAQRLRRAVQTTLAAMVAVHLAWALAKMAS